MEQQKQKCAVENAESQSIELISRKEAIKKGLKRYFTGKPCKHGHVDERRACDGKCVACKRKYLEKYWKANKIQLTEKKKEYNKKNKESLAAKKKEYAKNNKERITSRAREYYKNNKDRITEYKKKYRQTNIMVIEKYRKENKEQIAKCRKKYNKDNPLSIFTRCSIARIERAVGKGRIIRAETELGYTQKEFKLHIESLWLDGMSWKNRGDWHIDHIKPLSAFLKEGITEVSIINALPNLQPLWASDNLSKGAKCNV